MNKLINEIKNNAIKFGSIPFWSWNDKLQPDELRRQIRNMHDMEMRGFFMHARGGLETEYLSEDWYECVKACIDEAKKLDMEAWAYDENGWPSGFAGGILLEDPENHSVYVEHKFTEKYPTELDRALAVYAFDENGIPKQTEAPVDGCAKYLTVYKGTDDSYVDTMRADVIAKFIEATHEDYKKRLGDDFGKAMPGFFTDEPQYYRWRTPFSNHMDMWFKEEYGYSVLEALPALFCDYEGAEKYRYDYHKMTYTKFTSAFSKQIYDWAEANGVQITGHFIEEQSLRGQMLCCGDIMPQYQYEHIPGMDYLGRGLQTDVAPKQLGSVCAQTGRKKVLSEMFACCGWDVSPRELKHIAELQYAGGVTVMCQHLYPYSIRGQRKRDYPAHYSEHNPWQADMKQFDRYFNHLGYMLGMGEEYANTLVIHPIHSAWLIYRRVDANVIEPLDRDLASLAYLLSGHQIPYHYGSETMMATMSEVSGNTINVGKCAYENVVIPACDTLDRATVELLKKFAENGGKIFTYKHHLPTRIDGAPADLSFLSGYPDISEAEGFEALRNTGDVKVTLPDNATEKDVRMMVRNTEYGRLIYITNLSEKDLRSVAVSINNCTGLGKMSIEELTVSPIAGRITENGTDILIDLNGSEAVILTEFEAPEFLPYKPSEEYRLIKLPKTFKIEAMPENMLALDRACVSYDGINFTTPRPIERIRDNLLREKYRGNIWIAYPFIVHDIPDTLSIVTEPMGIDTLNVNGKTVTIGNESKIDPSFRVTDIAPYVKKGQNTVIVKMDYFQRDYVYHVLYGGVSETLRNCLVFDTEIENAYLIGNFALETDPSAFKEEKANAFRYARGGSLPLISPKDTIDITNIVKDGYPFYCGKLTFSCNLDYKSGDPTLLHLTGRYATAHVSVNGKEAGTVLFSEYIELADHLVEGRNTITVTICNAYRNLLGPHHRKDAEPFGVGPATFSFEKEWNGEKCDGYVPNYAFVRFGIDI